MDSDDLAEQTPGLAVIGCAFGAGLVVLAVILCGLLALFVN